jgi:hypothetical protein
MLVSTDEGDGNDYDGSLTCACLRERRRRGKLQLTIDLHQDDLREIALRGYEGAASSDQTLQAEAVTLYLPWS